MALSIRERNERIAAMHRQGRLTREIGEAFGLTRRNVNKILMQQRRTAERQALVAAVAHLPFAARTLEWLPLSRRTRKLFSAFRWRAPDRQPPTPQLVTVADLLQWSVQDLWRLKGFGARAWKELDDLLMAHGVRLRPR